MWTLLVLVQLFGCETGWRNRDLGNGEEGSRVEEDQTSSPTAAPPIEPAPTGDALADKIGAEVFKIASNYLPTSALVRHKLEKGKGQAFRVTLPGPPYCHAFFAASANNVEGLTMTIAAAVPGPRASRRSPTSLVAITDFCPATKGDHTLTVRMMKNAGELAVQVFSIPHPPQNQTAK